ncbi:hypothetical protein [Echinicola salinicaeni]|nr:hypothetical protein [Echinicola salinicaeni]
MERNNYVRGVTGLLFGYMSLGKAGLFVVRDQVISMVAVLQRYLR